MRKRDYGLALAASAALFWLFGSVSVGALRPDAVSGASVRHTEGDGFVLLMNRARYSEAEMDALTALFSGEAPEAAPVGVCRVSEGDEAGKALAEAACRAGTSLRLVTENGLMLVSKAEYAAFDVILLSRSAAVSYSAATLYQKPEVEVRQVEASAP